MAKRLQVAAQVCTLPLASTSRRSFAVSAPFLHRPPPAHFAENMGQYSPDEAANLVRAYSRCRQGKVDLHLEFQNVDEKRLARLRGRVNLPHPFSDDGAERVIAVIASGPAAEAAREAGATHVGTTDLLNQILKGDLNPSRLLATVDTLPLVQKNAQIARFLGPKGLMPSVKKGTVVDVNGMRAALSEAQGGLDWAGDPEAGRVYTRIASLSNLPSEVSANMYAVLNEVSRAAEATYSDEASKQAARPEKLFKLVRLRHTASNLNVDINLRKALTGLSSTSTATKMKSGGYYRPELTGRERVKRLGGPRLVSKSARPKAGGPLPPKLTPEASWKLELDERRRLRRR